MLGREEEQRLGVVWLEASQPAVSLPVAVADVSLTPRQQRLLSLVRAGDAAALRRALTGGCGCCVQPATHRVSEVDAAMGVWGFTLLHEAAYRNQLAVVQLLVQLGADVNAADKVGHSHSAITQQRPTHHPSPSTLHTRTQQQRLAHLQSSTQQSLILSAW